ncbi:hypothetical protein PACTADRAFT_50468 [Pachysolen tannophilus NRRL Y-2460]|uniref:Protein kinase domain-containing protein n=1 Tax=Pachysolen tannophilus NRRL Y-2460 TaxID=669874 RepID=A0A1E4TS58_PACTA|nr:hypothetical protein PACTADRAFT_50468 [Pachysolen tannophilus NRRL Y-2460]
MEKNKLYINRKRIYSGPFSAVYKAEVGLGNGVNEVALKITDPMDDRPPHNSRIELKTLMRLNGKGGKDYNVIELLDDFEIGDELIMVFPFYPFNLEDVIKANSKKKINLFGNIFNKDCEDKENDDSSLAINRINKLPLSRAKEMVIALAKSLSFLHKNKIIHRDIKPENILFKSLDSDPVLIDFGISWTAPDNYGKEPSTKKITDIATGLYKAPELMFSLNTYSSAVDIWALAIVMTLIYSQNCEPILDNDGNFSDLALLSSILQKFGTQNLSNWEEVKHIDTFQKMNFFPQKGLSVDEILPRCDDINMKKIFTKATIYQSSSRITADEILDLLVA